MRGLRREAVAQLAMISTDYNTRLEQGRLASASGEVLDALASALRLSEDERSYLYWWAERHVNYASLGTRTCTHPLTGRHGRFYAFQTTTRPSRS